MTHQAQDSIRSDKSKGFELAHAICSGEREIVKNILDSGFNVDYADSTGWTPLIYASRYGQPRIVGDLCRRGADVNYQNNGGNGEDLGFSKWTPLFYASRYGHSDIMRVLLDWRADPNTQNSKGETFLDYIGTVPPRV